MLRSTELIIDHGMHYHIIRDSDLAQLFKGSNARRYALVNKALKQGELIQLRRGYYILPNKYLPQPFDVGYLTTRLVAHSYLSAESALSTHGWIPERIQQNTSICAFGRNRSYHTPLGDFFYYTLPILPQYFFHGVECKKNMSYWINLATPLRAIMDYIYLHKIENANVSFLVNSLRIEEENVFAIDQDSIQSMMLVYQSSRVQQFLSNLLLEVHHEQFHHRN